jgi:GDP-mannose 6-dehydrogenase
MRIGVFGLGYVGCVAATCLARDGHSVTGIDVNPQKVKCIKHGQSPIMEPGLEALIADMVRSSRLQASMDSQATVRNCDVSLVSVGTPSNGNGSLNLQYVENVCREIGAALATKQDYHVVIIRSTVLPGTVQQHLIPLLEQHSGKRAGVEFGVCMNPEFLREGSALEDYYHPSQTIIGELDQRSGEVAQQLYAAVDAPIIRTAIQTAEMVKYVNNAFHAAKVVFANEIGNLCKAHQIDGQEVMEIFCKDRRLNIAPTYLKPGFAFGGSCLPKDVRALLHRAKEIDIECSLLSSLLPSNQKQIHKGIELIENIGKKKIGVLGLSFKANTDDVRESPVVALVETLVGRGYHVHVYDEHVDPKRLIGANKSFLERELPHIASLMGASLDEVITQAEVIVIANGSPVFQQVPQRIREEQVLIDLVGTAKSTNGIRGAYVGLCW